MENKTPQWIIDYDKANHQSSAGKAVRYLSLQCAEMKEEREQLIAKWEDKLALHRRVCDDPLMYTVEDRRKNSHYAQVIASFLSDIKALSGKESKTDK